MDIMHSQRGVTLIGWLIIICFFILIGIGAMRLYPLYYDHYLIVQSMENLASDPTMKSASVGQAREKLARNFTVNAIDKIDPKLLEIDKKGGTTTLIMKYEARAPFIYNIEFAVKFEDKIVVK